LVVIGGLPGDYPGGTTAPPPLIPPGYYPKGTPAPSDSPGVLSQDAFGTTERSKVVDSLPLLGPRSQSTRQWKAPKQASNFLCRASNFLCRASKKKASKNLGGGVQFVGCPPGAPDPIKLPTTPASPTRESKSWSKNENKTWSNFVPPTKMARRLCPKPLLRLTKNLAHLLAHMLATPDMVRGATRLPESTDATQAARGRRPLTDSSRSLKATDVSPASLCTSGRGTKQRKSASQK
jgi:hypothetical protein